MLLRIVTLSCAALSPAVQGMQEREENGLKSGVSLLKIIEGGKKRVWSVLEELWSQ